MVARDPLQPGTPVIAFAGGGTGGHVYPALAIADALRASLPGVQFQFFGTQRPLDRRIVDSTEMELIEQPIVALERMPWRWPRFLLKFRRSTLLCRAAFAKRSPVIVVGTGGLASVPAVKEAARAGIPTALLNPDAIPGRANRILAGVVDVVFAQWAETIGHFERLGSYGKPRVRVTGCPVRPDFLSAERQAGIERFGLRTDRRTLLITGASQGARNINQAVLANLAFLKTVQRDWQIVHLTGEHDFDAVTEGYRRGGVEAVILRFTEHMADALAVADLVIARAGASSLAEITAVGRASILMPYPYHRDQHQLANARCLARDSAARIVRDQIDASVNGPALREVLETLMADGRTRGMMAEAARRMGQGQAAATIADHLLALAHERKTLTAPTGTASSDAGRNGEVEERRVRPANL